MKTIALMGLLIVLTALYKLPPPDKNEAKAAFELLNKIRQSPMKYADSMPFLKELKAMPQLRWNDTLARVAEAKALDMATRNYFAHVDPDGYAMNYYINKAGYKLREIWLTKPTANYFESCNAGATSGQEAIKMLLIDNGVPSLGHRIHLLGLDEWSSSLLDIGIGYAHSDGKSTYGSYTCVLIAKH